MQNRRLLHDDDKGVVDPLNETQADGRGIAVNAKYYVAFNTLDGERSVQRRTQLLTDEPLQFFYTSTFTSGPANDESNIVHEHLSAMSSQLTDFHGELKLHQFPEGKNQVLIRIENIMDLFDGPAQSDSTFDVEAYAISLYKSANDGQAPASVEIVERTLSNNQDMKTMLDNKFKWKSVENNARLAQPYPEDVSETNVALQPQRIRLFSAKFTHQTEAEILTQ